MDYLERNMDYLERNIKDSYNQKTILINAPKTQGSNIIFWLMVIVWGIAVVCWKLAH